MAVIPSVTVCGLNQQKLGILLILVFQIILLALFAIYVRYGDDTLPPTKDWVNEQNEHVQNVYPMFMDVHVMIFVGFGFLMTFLKRYAFGAVAFNFLVAAMIIQWAILSDGFYNLSSDYKIHVNIVSLLRADIAAAAVLISMGAVLGRTTYIQLLIMGIIEIALYSANNYLAATVWKVSDAGASIFVHSFGAYFGLAVSLVLNLKKHENAETEEFESTYTSDTFAMVGTLFLWMFWPSFNAAEVTGDSQHRAILNTYISLSSCCVATFIMSWILGRESKFDMVHIQNSTLAGGVAVGATADLMIQPFGAMLIGIGAAAISVFGYTTLTPLLEKHLKLPDTCGVHNLHGMPGVFAGIISAIVAATATTDIYHDTLYQHYPAMAPMNISGDHGNLNFIPMPGDGRSASEQGSYQALALVATVAIAIVGGLITGFILSFKLCNPKNDLEKNKDDHFWVIPVS